MIEKDSSLAQMCYYNSDMVQINDMKKTDVTISINNVWTASVLPQQLQVFVNTKGVDSVRPGGDGFQCLDDDGTDIDVEGDSELTVPCYQEGGAGNATTDSSFLATIDVVVTDR